MSWDEPTQEELDDAIIEDTVRCSRCQVSCHVTETYCFDAESVCEECTQDAIDALLAERDRLRETLAFVSADLDALRETRGDEGVIRAVADRVRAATAEGGHD